MKSIYIVVQIYGKDMSISENIAAYSLLEDAQHFAKRRDGVTQWKEHNAHGPSWESLDGHSKYTIDKLELDYPILT